MDVIMLGGPSDGAVFRVPDGAHELIVPLPVAPVHWLAEEPPLTMPAFRVAKIPIRRRVMMSRDGVRSEFVAQWRER